VKRSFGHYGVILLFLLLASGCTGVALHATSSLVPDLTRTFFEECDLKLAQESLPAQLKLMEGLLKGAPTNTAFLTALSMGFTGYAMLFVEEEDPHRASRLYLRARTYGLRAIGTEGPAQQGLRARLKTVDKEALAPLFWATMSWYGWINLNLDDPEALAEMGTAQACLDRIMEIDPDYFFGAPYLLAGSMLAARPQMLGGDAKKAKEYFSRAMAVSHGTFFLAPYYYAKYYAVRAQDRALFIDLLSGVAQGQPDHLKEVCLINAAIQKQAEGLITKADDLFF
jgi:tetratricopeptide (TPR) repeat protein